MTPIKIISTQHPNILAIRWDPNNVCNYKCEYCWPGSNTGEYSSPENLDLMVKNFTHLVNQYKIKLGKTKIHLSLGGGEPTLWKELESFIELIKKENNIYVSLISNGSRTLRWWKDHGNLIDDVHLSYHISQADPDHMIAVADTMFEYNKKVTVKILMDKKHWEKGLQTIAYMKRNSKHKWFISVCEVIGSEVGNIGNIKVINEDYTQLTLKQKRFLKNSLKRIPSVSWLWKNRDLFFKGYMRFYESIATLKYGKKIKATTNTYINNNWHSFEGWSCDIGLDDVYISCSGEIRGSCQQTIYGLDYYFNILDEDFVSKFNPEFKSSICSIKNCLCSCETHVSKRKLS